MASHLNRVDPPSRDMTAAEARQRELNVQIEAFLAKGGEIQAFDPQRRPIEPTPWSAFQINPAKAKAQRASTTKADSVIHAATIPLSEVVAKPVEEAMPERTVAPTIPVVAEPTTADQAERVVAKILAPESLYAEVAEALRELRKHAVAMHLVLDRIGVRR